MLNTDPRNATIDPTTGHRVDPLTGIDIDQAIIDRDDRALLRVEIAQLEASLQLEPENWYLQHSLKSAKRRAARAEAKFKADLARIDGR